MLTCRYSMFCIALYIRHLWSMQRSFVKQTPSEQLFNQVRLIGLWCKHANPEVSLHSCILWCVYNGLLPLVSPRFSLELLLSTVWWTGNNLPAGPPTDLSVPKSTPLDVDSLSIKFYANATNYSKMLWQRNAKRGQRLQYKRSFSQSQRWYYILTQLNYIFESADRVAI